MICNNSTILHEYTKAVLTLGFCSFILAKEKVLVVVMVKNRDGDSNMIIMMLDLITVSLIIGRYQ